jgi:multicomponent Na+:H+ antiporter subunit G
VNGFEIVSLILITAGAFFLLVGSVGIVRLPDFYSRTHATGKSDTLGLMLAMLGLAVHEGLEINSAKLLVVIVFVALTSPVGTHALTRAAYQSGLRPWFVGEPVPEDPTEEASGAGEGSPEGSGEASAGTGAGTEEADR